MSSVVVPDGYRLHTENTTHILLEENAAFLNPVQEFNRDLSVACIKSWSEEMNEIKRDKILSKRKKQNSAKRPKLDETVTEPSDTATEDVEMQPEIAPHRITILEPLSATGLRSIRYSKEIPFVKRVIANDLSPDATRAIRRNVEVNGLSSDVSPTEPCIEVAEGDACTLMYNHRVPTKRVDVIDLDPYGTAAPFIDAAVQCVVDGGLLCITCTDLAVLATTNNAEKCFTNYGGIPMKTEYCHEGALRLVLHTVSTSASRYGRYITPLLSLSIDFYVRIWIKVDTKPIEVKKALGNTATYYVCSYCQTPYEQPLGKLVEKGSSHIQGKVQQGPTVPSSCPECNSVLHLAGPMWSGPLHKPEFVKRVLKEVESNEGKYGTAARMKGMLTVASEEVPVPFYFSPGKMSSFFRCTTISLDDFSSALLHDGHRVSRSHALAGSLKTDAPRSRLHDIMRTWCQKHPVRLDKMDEGSPARTLVTKDSSFVANFEQHPDCATSLSSKVKLLRYPEHPPNWGPAKKASGKRKREDDVVD